MENHSILEYVNLRQKAEELLTGKCSNPANQLPLQLSEADTLKLIYELQVHQIELELQNEELVTARKVSESASDKYIELYDFAPSGYFTLSKEGQILELNLCGSKMLGKERLHLKDKLFDFFLLSDSRLDFDHFLQDVFKTKNTETCEVTFSGNSERPRVGMITGKVAENPELCYLTIVDITDRKQAELELVSARHKAEESDRLKSAFLANMSHEIRTPMNGILGFAELLKEPGLTGEEQMKYLGIIEKSGARMLNIINNIVDISKIESGIMEAVFSDTDINEKVQYIYHFFKPEVEKKGIKFLVHLGLPNSAAVISTDKEKLSTILSNLIKNAIKYCDSGTIEIGYEIRSLDKTNKPAVLEFFVRDTGIGIARDRHEAIFERFMQADIYDERALQGAGLGLSIAQAYAHMLGGKITVESEPGKGSSFYFTLPLHTTAYPEKVMASSLAESGEPRIKKLKILIVEDDETADLYLALIFKNLCREIMHAKTGLEAIGLCRNNPDIDLILMDIKMPGMDGYEATRQIRRFNPEVLIIAQTAYGLSDDRQKSISAGCNDYIAKPTLRDDLFTIINKYFE